MNLDNLLNFPTPVRRAPANTKRAITERRVIAQMRNHLSEPVANGQDCLNEYRRMAVSVCREHIATLVELEEWRQWFARALLPCTMSAHHQPKEETMKLFIFALAFAALVAAWADGAQATHYCWTVPDYAGGFITQCLEH